MSMKYSLVLKEKKNPNKLIRSTIPSELGTDFGLGTLESAPFPGRQNRHMELGFETPDLVTEL